MNSIIEAQHEFTDQFGELTISHLCSRLILPVFSREAMQLDEFINNHQEPAPVIFPVTIYNYGPTKMYDFK